MTEDRNTELGLEENVEGALCYLLGFITGILFFLTEKENKFIRFHAVQSIIFSVGLWFLLVILTVFFAPIPYIGYWISVIFTSLVRLGGLVLWLFLMYKAYEGEKFKLPVIGEYAEHYAEELDI